MFPALFTADHCTGAYSFYEIIAHGRQRGVPVHSAVLLHLHNAVLHQIQLVFRQSKPVHDFRVTFHNLGRRKPGRHTNPLRMILHLMADRMDTAVHRPLLAKIRHLGIKASGSRLPDGRNQILDSLVLGSADGHHRNAQRFLHGLCINGTAVSPHLVHHIKGNHHGNMQLQKLERQIQVSFNVGGVHNIDNPVRLLL